MILAKNFLSEKKKEITIKSFVKINLNLEIGKKLESGYHELSSLFQSVSLYDILTISKKEVFTIEGCIICENHSNLLTKAKRLMEEHTQTTLNCSIHLIKACPISAGLGG